MALWHVVIPCRKQITHTHDGVNNRKLQLELCSCTHARASNYLISAGISTPTIEGADYFRETISHNPVWRPARARAARATGLCRLNNKKGTVTWAHALASSEVFKFRREPVVG